MRELVNNNWRRCLAFVLIFAMVLCALPFMALAKADSGEKATEFTVNLVNGNQTTLVKEYTIAELKTLSTSEYTYYSSIDSLPVCVFTVAEGAYVTEFVEAALKQIQGVSITDIDKIVLRAQTDGWNRSFTLEELNTPMYYYGDIYEKWNYEDGIVGQGSGAYSQREVVKPMLAVKSYQVRISDGRDPLNHLDTYIGQINDGEMFRFCIGMNENDLNPGATSTSRYGRWVNQMDIVLKQPGEAPKDDISVTGLTLDQSQAQIKKGNTVQLSAAVVPQNATNPKIFWESSNTSVATVSENGLVTGVFEGTATITAASKEKPSEKKSCIVTVMQNNIPVTDISLDKTKASVLINSTLKLSSLVLPSSAHDRRVDWSSSDQSIATVDENGAVTAHKLGNATITATTKDGAKTASCEVAVVDQLINVTGIALDQTNVTLKPGKEATLLCSITPVDATNQTILWSVDTPGVATVNTNGKVSAKGLGSAVITATTEDGRLAAQCKITVTTKDIIFSDIDGMWAEDTILEMVDFGVINGYSDASFQPDKSITRAEFVTILIKALEKTQAMSAKPGTEFNDTKSHWAKDAISIAVSYGIVTGYTDLTFGPDHQITREQMAAVMVRAFAVQDATSELNFTDKDNISPWAKDAVRSAVGAGIMNGMTQTTFAPQDKSTRAQAAAVIFRMLKTTGKI